MRKPELLKLAYSEALAQLRLHPSLIWTRNNFFLLIDSGILAFHLGNPGAAWHGSPLLIPIVGLSLSIIWVWVNLAGLRLQRHWRMLVLEIEKELFESCERDVVAGPFSRAANKVKEGQSLLVSITSALVVLAGGSCLCWIYLLLRAIKIAGYPG